ncbi:hypothetical protein [Plantibacter sp. RU18]|uniref:hypothetical protein n=1 Tax=Plantibacter sp. RU18 TaxID=3158143 RepID=UPI003D361B0B
MSYDADDAPEDPYGSAPPEGDQDGEHARVGPATGAVDDGVAGADPWADSDDPLAPIMGLLAGMQEAIDGQQQQIDELNDMLTAIPDGPWAWHMLNRQEREKLWKKLYDWVAWLEDRYLRYLSSRVVVFAADWYRHPVAVELLTALMVAHTSAYRRKTSAPSFVLVEWHERCLWPTLQRLSMLGITSEIAAANWDGPEQRPTRRDDDRFAAFLRTDLTPTSAVRVDQQEPVERAPQDVVVAESR